MRVHVHRQRVRPQLRKALQKGSISLRCYKMVIACMTLASAWCPLPYLVLGMGM